MYWLIGSSLMLVLLLRLFLDYPRRPAGVHNLTGRETTIVSAAADAMFPRGGTISESGTQAGVVYYLDAQLGLVSKKNKSLIRLLFLFVELSPFVFGPRRRRFTRLSEAEQTRVLRQAASSHVYFYRLSFLSLRTLLCMGYLANDSVNAQLDCVPNTRPFAT
jgi:hypothetical protein